MADIFYAESGYVDNGYFNYIADAASAQQTTATMEVTCGIVKEAEVEITPAFSPSMLVNVLKNHTAVLDSTASFEVTANKTTDTGSLLEYFAALDAMADVTRDVATTLDSAFSQSISISLIKETSSTQDSTFTLDVTAQVFRLHEGAATLESTFTQSSSADRIREDSTTQDSAFTIEAKITPVFEGTVLEATLGTMDITAERIREDSFTFDAIATSLIVGEFVPQEADATLSVITSLSVNIEKIYALSSTQDAIFTQSVSADRTREDTFTFNSVASTMIVGGQEENAIVNLSVAFTQTANVLKVKKVSSSLTSTASSTFNPIEYITRAPSLFNKSNTLEEGVYDTSWTAQSGITIENQRLYMRNNDGVLNTKAVRTNVLTYANGTAFNSLSISGDFCFKYDFYSDSFGPYIKELVNFGGQYYGFKVYTTQRDSGRSLVADFYTGYGLVTITDPNVTNLGNDNWHTIIVRRVGSTFELRNETGLLGSVYSLFGINRIGDGRVYIMHPGSVANTTGSFAIDNVSLQIGSNDYNFTNIANVQDQLSATTVFNFDFTNGYDSNSNYNALGNVNLTSTSSLSISSSMKRSIVSIQSSLGTLTVKPNASFVNSASLSSAFTTNIIGRFKPQEAEAQLSSTFTSVANPIEYQLKTYPYNRPFKWVRSVDPFDDLLTTNTQSYEGTYSGYIYQPTHIYRTNNALPSIPALTRFNVRIYFKPSGTLASKTILQLGGTYLGDPNAGVRLYTSNGFMRAAVKVGSYTYNFGNSVGSALVNNNTWHYMELNYALSGTPGFNQLSFMSSNNPQYLNIDNDYDSMYIDINSSLNTSGYGWLGNPTSATGNDVYFDGIEFGIGNGSTYDTTVFNFDFEKGTAYENTAVALFGTANLSSNFTFSPRLNYKTTGASLQTSAASLTTIIGVIYPRTANLSSAFTATINGMFKPQEAEATLSSTASIVLDNEIIRTTSSSVSSTFTEEVNAVAVRDVNSSQSVVADLTTSNSAIRDILSTQSSEFALVAGTGYLKETATSQIAQFTESANAITYIRKTYPFGRPHRLYEANWENNAYTVAEDANINLDYTNQQTGAACVQMDTSSTAYFVGLKSDNLTVTQIPAGTDFCFEINIKYGNSLGYGRIAWIGDDSAGGSPRNDTTITGIAISKSSAGYVTAKLYKGSAPLLTIQSTSINWSNFTNTWVRIAVRRVGSTVELYWNNTLAATGTYNYTLNFQPYLYLFDPGSTTNTYFDNLSLQVGSSNLNESGPTTLINTNPDTAVFNFDFENAYYDNTAGSIYYGEAQLNPFFTLQPVAVKSGYLVSLQSALGTMEINTGIIQQAQSDLQSEFTSVITPEFKAQEAEAQLSANTTLSVFAEGNKPASVSLTAFAAEAVITSRTLRGENNFFSEFQATFVPSVSNVDSVSISSTADLTASGVRTRNTPTDLFAEATSNIFTGDSLFNAGEADLTAQANIVVNTSVIRFGQASLDVAAAELTATTRFAGLLLDDLVQATMVVDGVVKTGSVANLDAQFALTTIIGTIEQNSAILVVDSNIVIDGTTGIVATSTQLVEATATINAIKTTRTQVNLSAFGSASMEIRLTKKGSINANVVATMAISANRVRSTSVAPTAAATINAIGGVFVLGQFNLSTISSITVSGKFIHIEDYIYIIPREYREFVLQRERRDFVIANETREYLIGE